MILIVHSQASKLIKVLQNGVELPVKNIKLIEAFWYFAEENPGEIIGWCEEEFVPMLNLKSWESIFEHNLIMASYAIKTRFLTDAIGYIDQLPFINVNPRVQYPTWLISSDIGGLNGEVLLKFQKIFNHIRNFNFLLNSISKLGQQNGILSYSAPLLVNETFRPFCLKSIASKKDLFFFVFSHYKSIRLILLFWCFIKYEKSFPILSLGRAFLQKKYFKKDIHLPGISKIVKGTNSNTIDVIIPTLGRREYLLQVLEDLKEQTLLPRKVIVVEQNPEINSKSELPELTKEYWPFTIIHHFTHVTGACNARNIALEEVEADWVFFADDDIRFKSDLLQNGLLELKRIGADCLNMNCKQKGEKDIFHKVKQWGSFASGTTIVNSDFCKSLRFNKIFEYGFGEDQDFGIQLRNEGCDIIYHPGLQILHLKAPRGGFREKADIPWADDNPKPSPTLMIFAKKHYNREQIRGFKTEMFLRYYKEQDMKNPLKYYKVMQERWKKSEFWAEKIISENIS